LLGFLGVVTLISLTTPAPTASSRMNFSTAAALSSLLLDLSVAKLVNLAINSGDPVWSVHFYAD
jgi:hypothetical protein